jgi:peptide chain release factor 1
MQIFNKLKKIKEEYDHVNKKLSEPINDQNEFRELAKKSSELEELVSYYDKYEKIIKKIEDDKELLNDEDLKDLASEEIQALESELEAMNEELKLKLIEKDPNDDKNVFLEIRAAAGGDESSLFAADILRMYTKYAENKGWKITIIDEHPTEVGGYKEVVARIKGRGAYSRLKYEGGVHRVQRVPETEASGRIHTSTITVAVMPEADETVDIEIKPEDIKIDTYRSSGAGGQHINKTDSAVRITHLPTGIVVSCQDDRSQHKNKASALAVLKSKLYELEIRKQNEKISNKRKLMVGGGDRSEKIRTYNYPQGRVTDHRIGLTLYKLQSILDGDLDVIIDKLEEFDIQQKLKEMEEE